MIKSSLILLGVCAALSFSAQPAAAQMVEIVTVKLPYTATVGNITLPAGAYTIRDLKEDGSSPVLEIRSVKPNGVSAMVVPTLAPNTRVTAQTQVVLRHEGNRYQVDKIWLQGRDYGYELPPASPRE
ncbi:MAG TPA: hypothetical protein VL285_13710 [Bryobacteraceae bacterium]|jgi:hypothetical protein|nr:hypothetical protein [Bryobacteraceae bacterium]